MSKEAVALDDYHLGDSPLFMPQFMPVLTCIFAYARYKAYFNKPILSSACSTAFGFRNFKIRTPFLTQRGVFLFAQTWFYDGACWCQMPLPKEYSAQERFRCLGIDTVWNSCLLSRLQMNLLPVYCGSFLAVCQIRWLFFQDIQPAFLPSFFKRPEMAFWGCRFRWLSSRR